MYEKEHQQNLNKRLSDQFFWQNIKYKLKKIQKAAMKIEQKNITINCCKKLGKVPISETK